MSKYKIFIFIFKETSLKVTHIYLRYLLKAVASTFQVLLQEGWPDVMNDALLANTLDLSPLVAIYFTMLHLFASSVRIMINIHVMYEYECGYLK